VATVSEVWGELQRAAGATDRLLELLHEKSVILEPTASAVGADLTPRLQVENVCFTYPSRPGQPALNQLVLAVPAGRSLALVGPSGAGKSTVFELLQRFHDPDSGSISLGGKDIRQLTTQELRRQLAVVPQAPAMFTADVAYNIGYGKPGASETEIIAAATAAHAHEFIERLPEGYQSHLGEQGVRLSGGQKQRIAIARAILKNPKLLLLDEATSALDAESEYQVQLALRELMQNRTTLIIAHRLSTILHADQIAVLDEGHLVATGTHQSLMQSCDLYQRLAELQFSSEDVA
jgi:ATP-binding cassette subfamily B protein